MNDLGERARLLVQRIRDAGDVDALVRIDRALDKEPIPDREGRRVLSALMRRTVELVREEKAEASRQAYAAGAGEELVPSSVLAPMGSVA